MGPSFPFHPLHFLFFRYFQVAPNVQKISRLTKDLVFGKMRERLNKEEVERLSQIGRDKQKVVVEHKEEKEGIEMETEPENEKR